MRLGEQHTRQEIRRFYKECVAFWLERGKSKEEAKELAFSDCSKLKYNPYSQSEDLDLCAKSEELLYIRIFE